MLYPRGGGEVRVAPHESGEYLIAEVGLNEKTVLYAAAGSQIAMVAAARSRLNFGGSGWAFRLPD
jgi:hypothetical protein